MTQKCLLLVTKNNFPYKMFIICARFFFLQEIDKLESYINKYMSLILLK